MTSFGANTMMGPSGLSGVKALHSQDAEAMFMEMTTMMDQAQDSLSRMQRLWGALRPLVQPNNQAQPSNQYSPAAPHFEGSPGFEGMPRPWMGGKGYQAEDLGDDQGCDLGKTCSTSSAMGTPASGPTGDLMDRQARGPVDPSGMASFATSDMSMQDPSGPPGLMKPQSKLPSQGVLDKNSPPTPAQLMMSFSAIKNLQKFDSVGSQELSHSLSLRKYQSIAGMSTAAQTEVMDGELDRSLDEVSDYEKNRLMSLVSYMRNRGGEANLSKSMSEPVGRHSVTEQYCNLGASTRDARVMDMMGHLIDEAQFPRSRDPTRLCEDSLANYANGSEMGYNNQASAYGHDQVLYDMKLPQFTSTPVRHQSAGGLSPQPAATAAAGGGSTTAQAASCASPDAAEFEDGAAPTFGSKSHASGTCKPCLFWYQGLCHKGWRCTFCHIPHHPKEVSRVRPSKKTRNLLHQHQHQMRPQQDEQLVTM